ncbi:MAG: ATP-binding cassette domain-containing protein, partial [bacterium]|nr:ATP-binding cassette domain-containing protein [bacterium]
MNGQNVTTTPLASGQTPDPSPQTLLCARNLHKHYRMGGKDLHVLRGAELNVARGEWVTILGASGSGKSTLLHLVGGLDRVDGGTVAFDGRDIYNLRGAALDRYRNRHVGFVFQ